MFLAFGNLLCRESLVGCCSGSQSMDIFFQKELLQAHHRKSFGKTLQEVDWCFKQSKLWRICSVQKVVLHVAQKVKVLRNVFLKSLLQAQQKTR